MSEIRGALRGSVVMWNRGSRTSARSLVFVWLAMLASQSHQVDNQHDSRISEFVDGRHGWRVLPSLPGTTDVSVDSSQTLLNVIKLSSPSHFIVPDNVTAEISAAVARGESQVSLQSVVDFPQACSAPELVCESSIVILGNRCAVQQLLLLPEVDLMWYLQEGDGDQGWQFCSALMEPDGTCGANSARGAMADALSSLQFVLISIEVKTAPGGAAGSAPPGPYTFGISSLELQVGSQSKTSFSAVPWLYFDPPPAPPRCTPTRSSNCEWDACDSAFQALLEASCQGPYGSAQPHCWQQPLPVRAGVQLYSFRLPNGGSCYEHRQCVGAAPVTHNQSTEVLTARVGGSQVWYWLAPSMWFASDADGADVAGMILQVELALDEGSDDVHAVDGPDVVIIGARGGRVECAFPRPVGADAEVFTVHLSEHGGCVAAVPGGGGAATVEEILRGTGWLFIRGVHARSHGAGSTRGSQLGAVALLDPPFSVASSFPSSGPMTGGTRVSVSGDGFSHVSMTQQACVWRCGLHPDDFMVANLEILNSSHVECSAPWVGVTAVCKMSLANLIQGKPYVTAILPDFHFYAPPFIDHLSAYELPAAGGVLLSLYGSGFAPLSSGRCRFVVQCVHAGTGGAQRVVSSAAKLARGSVAAPAAAAAQAECIVPPSPCVGPAVVSLSLNGVDYTHNPAECPAAGPMGCRVELVSDVDEGGEDNDEADGGGGDEGAPGDADGGAGAQPTQGDDLQWADLSAEGQRAQGVCCSMDSEKDCLACCSAFTLPLLDATACLDCCSYIVRTQRLEHLFATIFSVLVPYGLLAYPSTRLAVSRRKLREDSGSEAPYDMWEAYLLWLVFGPLGAHRYYLGERGNFLLAYGASLGMFGLLWLVDGWSTREMVTERNKRATVSALGAAEAHTNLLVEREGSMNDPYVDLDAPESTRANARAGGNGSARGLIRQAGSMAAATASGLAFGKSSKKVDDELEMTSLARPQGEDTTGHSEP